MASFILSFGQRLIGFDRVLVSLLLMIGVLGVLASEQMINSLAFMGKNALLLGPFILLSVSLTAYVKASGADNLVVKAFQGQAAVMIVFAALMGTLSPFCSCGVIPLIAAMLGMGVPLSAVMAFWLASPIMDPSMFVMTVGTIGTEFAIAKLLLATLVGMAGGFSIMVLEAAGAFTNPLRAGVLDGKKGEQFRNPKAVIWKYWTEDARNDVFMESIRSNFLFLSKWLALAFFLESLMIAYVPAESIVALVGGGDIASIAVATLAGIPAYLNGYVALPLVAGLLDQGMAPGAAMAFLVGGGVTSIPAAMAVWALARFKVFASYIVLSLIGAFSAGIIFQAWTVF